MQHDLAAERAHRVDLELRRGHRHHDHRACSRAAARPARRPARGCRPRRRSRRAAAAAGVRCAILLYAPRSLKLNTGCVSSRLSSTWLPRRADSVGAGSSGDFDRDVVDARGQDLLQVVGEFERALRRVLAGGCRHALRALRRHTIAAAHHTRRRTRRCRRIAAAQKKAQGIAALGRIHQWRRWRRQSASRSDPLSRETSVATLLLQLQ